MILDTSSIQEGAIALYDAMAFTQKDRSTLGRWQVVWFEMAL